MRPHAGRSCYPSTNTDVPVRPLHDYPPPGVCDRFGGGGYGNRQITSINIYLALKSGRGGGAVLAASPPGGIGPCCSAHGGQWNNGSNSIRICKLSVPYDFSCCAWRVIRPNLPAPILHNNFCIWHGSFDQENSSSLAAIIIDVSTPSS